MEYVFKSHFQGDIRRCTVDCFETFRTLRSRLSKLYAINDFDIKHIAEDGDHVTIVTDRDLHEVMRATTLKAVPKRGHYRRSLRLNISLPSAVKSLLCGSRKIVEPNMIPVLRENGCCKGTWSGFYSAIEEVKKGIAEEEQLMSEQQAFIQNHKPDITREPVMHSKSRTLK